MGAIVQAVITIYNMVQFFIERAKQIAVFVDSVFNSIAESNIKKAVVAVEDSLAKGLPVAIGFLANLVGIGGIAAKVKEIIQKIRKPIDKAVGKAVGFMVGKAKGLIGKFSGAEKPKEELPKNKEEHDIQVNAGLAAIDTEEQKYLENKEISRENAVKVADTVKKAYPVFKSITVVDGGKTWDYDYVASPGKIKKGLKQQKKPYSNPNNRPSYGERQVEKVWENAQKKDVKGRVFDPNTNKELFWDKTKPRNGQWDMGHTQDAKYSELHKKYMSGEIDYDTFIKEYRDPKNYRPEDPFANQSHKYE